VKQNLTFIDRCFDGVRDLPGCERNNKKRRPGEREPRLIAPPSRVEWYASSRQGLMLSPCMGSRPISLVCLDSTNAAGECGIKQTTFIQSDTPQGYCKSVGHIYMCVTFTCVLHLHVCYMFWPVPRPSPGMSIQEPYKGPFFVRFWYWHNWRWSNYGPKHVAHM